MNKPAEEEVVIVEENEMKHIKIILVVILTLIFILGLLTASTKETFPNLLGSGLTLTHLEWTASKKNFYIWKMY